MQAIKRRKPVVALLMSAGLPGFGQLYNGEVNKALWLFIAFVLLSANPLLAYVGTVYLSGGMMVATLLLALAAALAIWVYGMVDAWSRAKGKQDYVLQRWQCSSVYALVLIVSSIVTLPMLTVYVRAHVFESFRIPSTSMEPSVLRGDFIMADKRYNCRGCEHRIEQGDIAVFTYPNDRTQLYIKRIIGLPGDRVQIEDHSVAVNGRPLTETGTGAGQAEVTESSTNGREWQVQWNRSMPGRVNVDLIVPPGEVFVLGDNRSNSRDSRDFETVPMQDVVGRARVVWFSYGPDGIRWSRLGKELE